MIYQVHICFKSFDNLYIDTSITRILQIRNYLKAFENHKSLVVFQRKDYNDHVVSLPFLKKKFTVLRSPHIDKKSREQFEWTHYKKSLFLSFQKSSIFSLFLFLLKNSSFPGVQIQISLKHLDFLKNKTYPRDTGCIF